MAQQKKYDRQIAAPVSNEMKEQVAQVAQSVGMSTAEFIRASLFASMLDVLQDAPKARVRLASAELAWELKDAPVDYSATDGVNVADWSRPNCP